MVEYSGFAYRQALDPKSPLIVSFVATAEELLKWVGIPRRSEKHLVGFQRLDEEARVLKAKGFFSVPENQSPTALIVGMHPQPKGSSVISLELQGDEKQSIRPCKITINFDPDKLTDDEVKKRIESQIADRLKASADEEEEAEEDEEDDGNDEEEGEDDEQQDDDESIELGRSLLQDLLENLKNEEWFKANREALVDFAKPATLIDGQHRIKGAELCERGIPFAVCALYNCSWPEQVFQFTVVNYTQNGIPDQFITANASLSLTAEELGKLETRLVQAEVKVIEYELMRVVNFDPTSPFKDLVNLSSRKVDDKIGYKTMVRVAKSWYTGTDDAVQQLIAAIYPDIKGKKSEIKRERLKLWKKGDWGEFFVAFWNEVKDRYAKDGLWDVGNSNLMIAVVLLELQAAFLKNLGSQDEEYFQPKSGDPKTEFVGKVKDRAGKFLAWFPPELFSMSWQTKSLNTGAGRRDLKNCFQSLVEKKGAYKYASSALVSGSAEKSK